MDPTPKQKALAEFAKEITYANLLSQYRDLSKTIAGSVTTVATIATVGGLVSLSTLLKDGGNGPKWLMLLASISGTLALGTNVIHGLERFTHLNPHRLDEVEDYLLQQNRRAVWLKWGQRFVVVALVFAIIGGFLAAIEQIGFGRSEDRPAVAVSMKRSGGSGATQGESGSERATFALSVQVKSDGVAPREAVSLAIAQSDSLVGYASESVGPTTSVDLSVEATNVGPGQPVTITYRSPEWTCTHSITTSASTGEGSGADEAPTCETNEKDN